ncbi:hypothetical protein F511_36258 [Dorcoceras hygrometricum]|uniref:CCHC-type domain-containing protein n=1 Tax=Dorcoceras hygrometricum TaxID=472368 RepID=A0A2Z7AE45_9LAMI|nr:hypothetical protein F511_36258 [Dorcoceras hygrometricum]
MGCPGQARTKPRRKSAVATMPGNTPDGGRTASAVATMLSVAQGRAPPRSARRMARDAPGCGATNCASLLANQQPPAAAKRAALGGMLLPLGSKHHAARDEARGQARAVCRLARRPSGIQLAVGPQPLRLRNHDFGLAQWIMVKRLAKSRHDPLGITDSACKNQLVVFSVQYGPFNTYIPIRSTTIGKSRVARDLIAMHTSWRSNSDIASVTRKVLVAEESTKSWADSDSDSSSSSSSSSDSEQEEVHCLMANQTSYDEVFKPITLLSTYNNANKSEKLSTDMNCYNCGIPGNFAADCNRPNKEDRPRRDEKKDDRSKERSKKRRMRKRSDKRPNRKNDRKVLVAEESTKSWADSDSDSSSSSSSSSDSEQEEVHCLMANQTSYDETIEEVKAENIDLKNSSMEPRTVQLGETGSLQIELSKLKTENESLRLRSYELESEIEKLNLIMSSWTQSSVSLYKLCETQKPANDRTGLGFNADESSSGETCTQSNLEYDNFKRMNFVKASVIHDTCESVRYDDQISEQLNKKGKAGIGYDRPESSKSGWIKNRLDKEKAKSGSKSFVQNQQRRGFKKVKSEWRKVQPRRYLNGQNTKPKLNISHHTSAHTLMDFHTGKNVKEPVLDTSAETAKLLELEIIGVDEIAKIVEQQDNELTADDVDTIIEQILAYTTQMEADAGETEVGEQIVQKSEETVSQCVISAAYFVEEPIEEMEKNQGTEISYVFQTTDEECMSLDELLATIPHGSVLPSTVGEITKIQFGHIELLIQLREKIIDEVDQFFNSFNLHRLAALKSDEDIYAKEEQVLIWAETDSTRVALQWQILFEGAKRDHGAVISRSNTNTKSSCWIRTMILVNGSWVIEVCGDHWKPIPRKIVCSEIFPQLSYVDTLPPDSDFHKLLRKRWEDVCIDVVQFSLTGVLHPVGTVKFCRDVVVQSSVVDISRSFRLVFAASSNRGDTDLIADTVETIVHAAPDSIPTGTTFDQDDNQRSDSSSSSSFSHDLMDVHVDTPVHFTSEDIPLGTETAVSPTLPPTTAITPPISQNHLLRSVNLYLSYLTAFADAFTQQDQTFRGVLKSVRQDVRNEITVLSVQMNEFKKAVRNQGVLLTTDVADVRKEVKDHKAELFTELDERIATIRSDLLDFREQAQENHLHLSTHLGYLVDYIDRGGDAKKGERGSSRLQPPLDDKDRGSGGSRGDRSGSSRK